MAGVWPYYTRRKYNFYKFFPSPSRQSQFYLSGPNLWQGDKSNFFKILEGKIFLIVSTKGLNGVWLYYTSMDYQNCCGWPTYGLPQRGIDPNLIKFKRLKKNQFFFFLIKFNYGIVLTQLTKTRFYYGLLSKLPCNDTNKIVGDSYYYRSNFKQDFNEPVQVHTRAILYPFQIIQMGYTQKFNLDRKKFFIDFFSQPPLLSINICHTPEKSQRGKNLKDLPKIDSDSVIYPVGVLIHHMPILNIAQLYLVWATIIDTVQKTNINFLPLLNTPMRYLVWALLFKDDFTEKSVVKHGPKIIFPYRPWLHRRFSCDTFKLKTGWVLFFNGATLFDYRLSLKQGQPSSIFIGVLYNLFLKKLVLQSNVTLINPRNKFQIAVLLYYRLNNKINLVNFYLTRNQFKFIKNLFIIHNHKKMLKKNFNLNLIPFLNRQIDRFLYILFHKQIEFISLIEPIESLISKASILTLGPSIFSRPFSSSMRIKQIGFSYSSDILSKLFLKRLVLQDNATRYFFNPILLKNGWGQYEGYRYYALKQVFNNHGPGHVPLRAPIVFWALPIKVKWAIAEPYANQSNKNIYISFPPHSGVDNKKITILYSSTPYVYLDMTITFQRNIGITLNSLNSFLFKELFNWSKNQHNTNSNSWILNKYWLFLYGIKKNLNVDFTPNLGTTVKFDKIVKEGLNYWLSTPLLLENRVGIKKKNVYYFCLKKLLTISPINKTLKFKIKMSKPLDNVATINISINRIGQKNSKMDHYWNIKTNFNQKNLIYYGIININTNIQLNNKFENILKRNLLKTWYLEKYKNKTFYYGWPRGNYIILNSNLYEKSIWQKKTNNLVGISRILSLSLIKNQNSLSLDQKLISYLNLNKFLFNNFNPSKESFLISNYLERKNL